MIPGDKLIGQYDFDGECAPSKGLAPYQTFSVGIFQLIPKARGRGIKRGKVFCRVKGFTSKPQRVYKLAEEICLRLNSRKGWKPKKKVYDAEKDLTT